MIKITIEGEPVAKGRPRFGKGRAFTPKKTRDFEDHVRWLAKEKMQGKKPTVNAVIVLVTCFFKIPASWPAWKRLSASMDRIGHTVSPDSDNAAKSVLDAVNGILYKDDAQIVSLSVSKYYSEKPRVEICMREIPYIPAQIKKQPAVCLSQNQKYETQK